ncbi:MAG: hypothetical protein AAF941_06965 [Pseudomonadota bacterium]
MPNPPAPRPTRKIARQATSRVAFESEPPSPDDPLLAFEPYRHKQPRSNSITPDLQREFVAHLAATGIVTSAARHIGRSMEALYKLRHKPGAQGFANAWDRAVQMGVERLEDSALARAIEGEERHIVSGGEVVATEMRHNEALVMFFLRNRLPERYGTGELKPGHPAYEAIKAELRAEWDREAYERRNSPEEREAKLKFINDVRERWRREWEAEQRTKASVARVLGGGPVAGE